MVNEVRKSTSLAVIPIQTIVFKSFSLAFSCVTATKIKGKLHRDALWQSQTWCSALQL